MRHGLLTVRDGRARGRPVLRLVRRTSSPPSRPREERKFVSVLFVDMVGSTAHADGADPEDVRDRNQLYYEEVRERIERYGGTSRSTSATR